MVIAAAAIALGATGHGLQMKGQYQAGKAAEAEAENQAAWQEFEAKKLERERDEQLNAAAVEERKHRLAGERLKARQRVEAGAANVLPIGSAELVMKETARELEYDALMIRRGGTVAAQGLTIGAQQSRGLGAAALLRGRNARTASRYAMIGTGLSGASQLGFRYRRSSYSPKSAAAYRG